MLNKDMVWKINKNGSIAYGTEGRVIKRRYTPSSMFEHSAAGMITLIVCASIDFALFYQMFSKILYDSPAIMMMSIGAMVIGFDFGPIYLGVKWRQHKQGYNVDKLLIYGLVAAFLIAFTANFVMRIAIRDMALPDLSADTTSIIGGTALETTQNPIAPVFSVFVAVLPLVTSIVSFVVSNATYNPLLNEKRALEEMQLLLNDDITATNSILAEYESDKYMLERMTEDDDDLYNCAVRTIQARAKLYGDYVRERIKEHMGEAPATNELSSTTAEAFGKRLDEVIELFKEDPQNSVIRRIIEEKKQEDSETMTM